MVQLVFKDCPQYQSVQNVKEEVPEALFGNFDQTVAQ